MRLLSGLFLCFAFALASCGGGSSNADAGAQDGAETDAMPQILATGTVDLSLEEYGLPFTLIVPDSTKGYPLVEETPFGETRVRVGKTFDVVIAFGGDLTATKADLQGDITFKNEVVEEGDDYIIYKSTTIEESFIEPEFHFCAVKTIGGETFEFHDFNDEGGYSEAVANFMMTSIKHLKAKDNSQSS